MREYTVDGRWIRDIGRAQDVGARTEQHNAYHSRGRIVIAHGAGTLFVFRSLLKPEVRVYGAEGSLKSVLAPWGEGLNEIVQRVKPRFDEALANGYFRYQGILNGAAVDPGSGDVWIAAAGPYLYRVAPDGRTTREYAVRDDQGRAVGIADLVFTKPGSAVAVVPQLGAFSFDVPVPVDGRASSRR